MTSEAEIAKDLEELSRLLSDSNRPRVQKVLEGEILKAQKELEKIESESKKNAEPSKPDLLSECGTFTKKVTTFAFDESDKFVKLYYTVPGVQHLPKEFVVSSFTDNSFNVHVKNLNGVDYSIEAKGFTDYIDPEKSTVKQKADSVLVMLKKIKEGKKWEKLLALEKKAAMDIPKFDESGDPQAALMSMMKNMYESGDDEMKRTIKKAFYESNQKKHEMGMGGFDM